MFNTVMKEDPETDFGEKTQLIKVLADKKLENEMYSRVN